MNTVRSPEALPKAHLHLHLDGSYPRAAVETLAGDQGVPFYVPDSFAGPDDFFRYYVTVPDLVRDLADLSRLCAALVHQEAAAGVCYCEPNIEPQLFAPRLGPMREVLETILEAFATAADATGIEVGALVIVNTDNGTEAAAEPASLATDFASRGVTAFGTAGFVEPAGLRRFAKLAETARQAGLRIVCHAGQTGGPDSIRDALEHMKPDRIAHGVQAVADPELLLELADRGVVLDIALSSNAALGIVESIAEHPVKTLIDAGVAVTLNADDQLWFGSSINGEYELARTVLGIDDHTLAEVALNGTTATNMSSTTRHRIVTGVAHWLAE